MTKKSLTTMDHLLAALRMGVVVIRRDEVTLETAPSDGSLQPGDIAFGVAVQVGEKVLHLRIAVQKMEAALKGDAAELAALGELFKTAAATKPPAEEKKSKGPAIVVAQEIPKIPRGL